MLWKICSSGCCLSSGDKLFVWCHGTTLSEYRFRLVRHIGPVGYSMELQNIKQVQGLSHFTSMPKYSWDMHFVPKTSDTEIIVLPTYAEHVVDSICWFKVVHEANINGESKMQLMETKTNKLRSLMNDIFDEMKMLDQNQQIYSDFIKFRFGSAIIQDDYLIFVPGGTDMILVFQFSTMQIYESGQKLADFVGSYHEQPCVQQFGDLIHVFTSNIHMALDIKQVLLPSSYF